MRTVWICIVIFVISYAIGAALPDLTPDSDEGIDPAHQARFDFIIKVPPAQLEW